MPAAMPLTDAAARPPRGFVVCFLIALLLVDALIAHFVWLGINAVA